MALAATAIWLAGFSTYTKGLAALRQGRLNINALMTVAVTGAFLIGHGTLRINSMGDDLNRVATAPEIKQMRELLDQSLEQGAIGMSSGLFYAVSSHASTDEVVEVATPLGKWGGVYTAHMRDEGDHILKAMDETFEIGRRVGAEIIVSHHKCSGRSNFGRMKETLPHFNEAMKKQQIAFDVYPYVAGSTILRSDMLERADKVLALETEIAPAPAPLAAPAPRPAGLPGRPGLAALEFGAGRTLRCLDPGRRGGHPSDPGGRRAPRLGLRPAGLLQVWLPDRRAGARRPAGAWPGDRTRCLGHRPAARHPEGRDP